MTMKMDERRYDVFLSYAHADARTDEQKQIVAAIKESIEQALKSVVGHNSCVFLDSEALKWGDEWNAKICKCIDQAKIFVFLLSPNYLRSDYCQREKLWWARHEIDQGRLNKTSRPIYYIQLPDSTDPVVTKYIEELEICQAQDRAFFDHLDNAKCDIVKARLAEIGQGIAAQVNSRQIQAESLCTV